MSFSILHISDLHRDLRDEVDNVPLLHSLVTDIQRYGTQDPLILRPSLCIVSGDLIFGVAPTCKNAAAELKRQFDQTVDFLVELTDAVFGGDRNRVVLVPGNHDVSYTAMLESCDRIEIPPDLSSKKHLTDELFAPNSRLRWSWSEVCFYRIKDDTQYDARLQGFATAYERFYVGKRVFSLNPKDQFELFDYPDLGFSVVALNSCYRNDPLRRAGGFNPAAFAAACDEAQRPSRTGWLVAATWHHHIGAGPIESDSLDFDFLQHLIDSGMSLGFHGHQHWHECVDERYRFGPSPRKMTVISASTLCAEPGNLKPGVPRGYNVVEINAAEWRGRVHSRQMINTAFDLPLWGPGHFRATGRSYADFELCKPLERRPRDLDESLALEQADHLLLRRAWSEAITVLEGIKDAPLARPLLVEALRKLGEDSKTVALLWPPLSSEEIVLVGAAILNRGRSQDALAFLKLDSVSTSKDASVEDIRRRITRRWAK